jgi:hypothetical protein
VTGPYHNPKITELIQEMIPRLNAQSISDFDNLFCFVFVQALNGTGLDSIDFNLMYSLGMIMVSLNMLARGFGLTLLATFFETIWNAMFYYATIKPLRFMNLISLYHGGDGGPNPKIITFGLLGYKETSLGWLESCWLLCFSGLVLKRSQNYPHDLYLGRAMATSVPIYG